jgi:hypothetical protein
MRVEATSRQEKQKTEGSEANVNSMYNGKKEGGIRGLNW